MPFSFELFKEECYENYGWFARMNSGQRIRNLCSEKEAGARRGMYAST